MKIKDIKNLYKFGLKINSQDLDRINLKRVFSLISLYSKVKEIIKSY